MAYDYEKMHADCVRWMITPSMEPWQQGAGLRVTITMDTLGFVRLELGYPERKEAVVTLFQTYNRSHLKEVMLAARIIGLDVESYQAGMVYDRVALHRACVKWCRNPPEDTDRRPFRFKGRYILLQSKDDHERETAEIPAAYSTTLRVEELLLFAMQIGLDTQKFLVR